MSIKKLIFDDINTAITANATSIKDVQIWNSQLDNETKERQHNYPVVFVEFSQMNWDKTLLKPSRDNSRGNATNQQRGSFIITLHIAFWQLQNETVSFPIIDTIIDTVYFAIEGLQGTNKAYYNPLLRISERQDVVHDNIIDWQIDFSCAVEQQSQEDTGILISDSTLSATLTRDMDIDNNTIRAGYDS